MTVQTVSEFPLTRDITWNEVAERSDEIADRLKDKDITAVIGIGRGGLVPAVIMSHKLGAPLVPIMWQNRDGEYHTNLETMITALNEGDTVLVTDDVSDSGKTLSQVVGMMYHLSSKLNKNLNIITAAIHQKSESLFFVHEYGELVGNNTWIRYPWEA